MRSCCAAPAPTARTGNRARRRARSRRRPGTVRTVPPVAVFKLVVPSLTRRQALKAGALAAAATSLRPAVPALAARPEALFEMSLDGAVGARAAAASWHTTRVFRAPRRFDLVGLVWARGSH